MTGESTATAGGAPRILAVAGSLREASLNKKLLAVARRGAEAAGAACTEVDLRALSLPPYDGDLEARIGLPDGARELRRLLGEHGGLLLASPEYNGSVPGVLKNAIDWATRSGEGSPDLSGFRGTVVALLAASPGPLGGVRGLIHLRTILSGIGCLVLPDQLTLRGAGDAFDAEGELRDPKQRDRAEAIGGSLARALQRLRR